MKTQPPGGEGNVPFAIGQHALDVFPFDAGQ